MRLIARLFKVYSHSLKLDTNHDYETQDLAKAISLNLIAGIQLSPSLRYFSPCSQSLSPPSAQTVSSQRLISGRPNGAQVFLLIVRNRQTRRQASEILTPRPCRYPCNASTDTTPTPLPAGATVTCNLNGSANSLSGPLIPIA